MKKRWIALLTVAVMLLGIFALSACGDRGGNSGGNNSSGGEQGGDTPQIVVKDDCKFAETTLTVEAGEVVYINITGAASAYVSSKPEVASVTPDGTDKLKVTGLTEGTATIRGLNKQGDPIDGAKCNLTVTQKLVLTMPETAEAAVKVPFDIPYTILGSGATFTTKLTYADSDETVPSSEYTLVRSADTVPVFTLTSSAEQDLVFTLTAKKSKTGETQTASVRISFVDFFQEKYYDYGYFTFDKEPFGNPENFDELPGIIPESVRKSIDESRADIAAAKGETGEEGGEGGESEEATAIALNSRAASREAAEGYTVHLSSDVISGKKVLPQNLVIPATYNGEPVTKIGSNFMYDFAEYRGETKSLDPNDKWVKPYESYAGFTAKTVFIPDSVIEIGEQAFAECPVTGVVVQTGSKLQTIGKYAFHRACKLTAFNFNSCTELKTIGTNAFTDNAFTSIFIPKSVTVIGSGAFAQIPNDANRNNHQTLKTLVFEDDNDRNNAVTVYGAHGLMLQEAGAFAYNLALNSVRLCNIRRVQTDMFAQSWALTDVYVDEYTAGYAFSPYKYDMTGYESYEYNPELDVYPNGDIATKGAYAYLDHNQWWGNPFTYGLAENGRAVLTIDNDMITKVNGLDFAGMKYDSRGLLGFFNGGSTSADAAKCYRFATLYVKDGLEPSAYVKSLYEKQETSEKDGYTKWVLTASEVK